MEDRELTAIEREIRARLSAQLDQLPVRSAPNFAPARRSWPLAFKLAMSTLTIALTVVLAVGIGQGVRTVRDRVAASQSPDTTAAPAAPAFVPPHLASPDSIVAVSATGRGVGAANARLDVFDSQTGSLRYSLPVADQAQAVFRAAGHELIVVDWPATQDLRIRFVDARTGAVKATLNESRPRPTLGSWLEVGAAVSPDGKLLALQRLAGAGAFGSPIVAGLVDELAFYDLEQRTRIDSVSTPGCDVGEIGFTDDGRTLFLACARTREIVVIDAATRKETARAALPPTSGTDPGFGGMVVVGSSATVVDGSGLVRHTIRADGSVGSVNLGAMFAGAVVPPGAIARVPRHARLFVGYGPAAPGTTVNDARIMDSGSSGGRFSITRTSVGGILADDRGGLYGADSDGSIWRRGSTTVSDDVTLVPATAGRSVRLVAMMRVSEPTILSRDSAARLVSAPNIRIDRVDRIEAKLTTLGDVIAASGAGAVVREGMDPAAPVWAVALRGEMHVIRGLVDISALSAIFVLDAQTGEPLTFLQSSDNWPSGFDMLVDRGPASSSPLPGPHTPVISGVAPIGDIAARLRCDGQLGTARLVAAFDSTAGAVADWTENVAFPNAPHPPSPWRQLPASAPAYVCYFDGQFASPGGPVGASVPPLIGRAVILVDAVGTVLGPSKYGPTESLPLNRPGGRF